MCVMWCKQILDTFITDKIMNVLFKFYIKYSIVFVNILFNYKSVGNTNKYPLQWLFGTILTRKNIQYGFLFIIFDLLQNKDY